MKREKDTIGNRVLMKNRWGNESLKEKVSFG